MKKAAGFLLLFTAVIVSGCTAGDNSPEIITGDDELSIQGNSTEQLEVQVKNNFEEIPASFQLNITSPKLVEVMNSENEPQTSFDMGEAVSGSKTVKKVLVVRGNPGELGSLNSGTDKITLKAIAETSENISESERTASKNVTVTVTN